MKSDSLTKVGIDYKAGVEKFMNRQDVFDRLLKNFINENSFDSAKEAIEKEDYEKVLKDIHQMKSVTGTLCMNDLYKLCCSVVDNIRANKFDDAKNDFSSAYENYTKIIEVLEAQ